MTMSVITRDPKEPSSRFEEAGLVLHAERGD